MRGQPLYEMGLVVHYNLPDAMPGKGSAIFFHLWRNENAGTAGCTAMDRENLKRVLEWLDKSKNPMLVQCIGCSEVGYPSGVEKVVR